MHNSFQERQIKDIGTRAPRLLVTGGSLGAKAINEALCAIAPELIDKGIEIWHQTGTEGYDFVRAEYRKTGVEQVRVESFIVKMPQAYEWADLVLCRAVASTLAEITAAGVAAILIPFPHAAHDHQKHNAKALESSGGAVVFDQKEISGENVKVLTDKILELISDKEKLEEMARKNHELSKANAASNIVDELEKLIDN